MHMTTAKREIHRAFGGDPIEKQQAFHRLATDLSGLIKRDVTAPAQYQETLESMAANYKVELAMRKRANREYPPEVEAGIAKQKKTMLKRDGIILGLGLILAGLFMLFGPSTEDGAAAARVISGFVLVALLLLLLTINGFTTWRSFKKYVDLHVLYTLPDTDFVTEQEVEDFKAKQRETDAVLIARIEEHSKAAQSLHEALTTAPHTLYALDASSRTALLAYTTAKDMGEESLPEVRIPHRAQVSSPEKLAEARQTLTGASPSVIDALSLLEVFMRTVEYEIDRSTAS